MMREFVQPRVIGILICCFIASFAAISAWMATSPKAHAWFIQHSRRPLIATVLALAISVVILAA